MTICRFLPLPAAIKATIDFSQYNVEAATDVAPSNQAAAASGQIVIDPNLASVDVSVTFDDVTDLASITLFGVADSRSLPDDEGVVAVRFWHCWRCCRFLCVVFAP